MNQKQIERIVRQVFEKAKRRSVSHSKYALAKQVVKEISSLNSKTLERAYTKYIEKKDTVSTPNPDTVDFLCKYIGYRNYEEYMSKKSEHKVTTSDKNKSKEKEPDDSEKNGKIRKKYTWSFTLKIVIVFGVIIAIANQLIRGRIQHLIAPM